MDHGPETDRLHDLLTAVGTGDRRAFDALYLRLSGRLHAVALRTVRHIGACVTERETARQRAVISRSLTN